jgi:hypothetical protein
VKNYCGLSISKQLQLSFNEMLMPKKVVLNIENIFWTLSYNPDHISWPFLSSLLGGCNSKTTADPPKSDDKNGQEMFN